MGASGRARVNASQPQDTQHFLALFLGFRGRHRFTPPSPNGARERFAVPSLHSSPTAFCSVDRARLGREKVNPPSLG